jgi:hypothetical protein
MKAKILIGAVFGGIVITFVTGWMQGFLLYTLAGGLQVLMGPLLGATNYGLPFVWRTVIVYPGSPTDYHTIGLVADLVMWASIVGLVQYAVSGRKK